MTARLHTDSIVGGTLLSFNDSIVGNAAYWEAVGVFHALLPDFLDGGNSFTYSVGTNSLSAYGTMPGANLTEVNRLLNPFLADLAHRNITPYNTPQVSPKYPLLHLPGSSPLRLRRFLSFHQQPHHPSITRGKLYHECCRHRPFPQYYSCGSLLSLLLRQFHCRHPIPSG